MAWSQRRRVLRLNWRLLAAALVVYVVGAAVLVVIQRTPTLRAFMAGVLVATLGWLLPLLLDRIDGTPAARGADAEESTSDELRRLRPRGGWYVIDDIEFDGFNVDHVALGPGGIFAVETKWTASRVGGVAGLADQRWQQAIDQARRGARKIRLLLRSRGVRAEVLPVLVPWGPAVVDAPEGSAVMDDVLVCWGHRSNLWRHRLEEAGRATPHLQAAREALLAYLQTSTVSASM